MSFLRELGHTGEINSLNDVVVDQMHQPWRTFTALINRGLSGKTSGLNKLRLSRAQILWGKFYQKNVDYVELLWEDFIYQIENRAYKKQEKMYYPRFTKAIIHHFLIQEKSLSWRNKIRMHTSKDDYLINSLRFVSTKESTQIYGAILPECLTSPAMKESKAYKTYLGYATDEEPVTKGKRVKRHAKKSTTKPTTGVIIREDPMKTKSKSKEKEKVDVTRGKGIELLSEGNDKDDSNNDQDSSNEDSEQENESEEKVSNSEQEEESKDDDQEEEEFVHTPSPTDDKDDDNLESESDDVNKSDKESDDVIKGDKEIIQGGGGDAEMIDAQQGNENLETTQEQVVEDTHVTIYTVKKKTEVPVTSSSHVYVHHEVPRTHAPTLLTIPVFVIIESSPVLTNIPQSSQTFTPPPILTTPTPPPTIETTNPLSTLPDFASVFRFNDRITVLEKEAAKLKRDPLHTQVTNLVDEHLDTRLGETREEFMNFLSESLTARIKEQVKDQLPQILPKEVRKDKDKDEDPSAGSDRGLKKRKLSKDTEPTSEEPVFEVADSDMPQDQEGNMGDNEDEPRKDTASRRDWFKKPTPPQEPTDPDWHVGKTTQERPPQKWLITLVASTPTDKSLKDFDELMSTPIDFSSYILNGLKINNLTQEILLVLAFRLLKGTRSNYAELEYDFDECYKALSEKLD
ncbi:hypothetical protein Tco_0983258 [Tanacetum coccineum]